MEPTTSGPRLEQKHYKQINERGLVGDFRGMIAKIEAAVQLNTEVSGLAQQVTLLEAFGNKALVEARLDQASALFMQSYRVGSDDPKISPVNCLSTLCKALIARCLAFPEDKRDPYRFNSQELTRAFTRAWENKGEIPIEIVEQFVIAAGLVGAGDDTLRVIAPCLRGQFVGKTEKDAVLAVLRADLHEAEASSSESQGAAQASLVADSYVRALNRLNQDCSKFPQLRVYTQLRLARVLASNQATPSAKAAIELAKVHFLRMQEDWRRHKALNKSEEKSQPGGNKDSGDRPYAPSPILSALILKELSRCAAEYPNIREVFLKVYDSLQLFDIQNSEEPQLCSVHYVVSAYKDWANHDSLTANTFSKEAREMALIQAEKMLNQARRFIVSADGIGSVVQNIEYADRVMLEVTNYRIKFLQGEFAPAVQCLRSALKLVALDGRVVKELRNELEQLAWDPPKELSRASLSVMWNDILKTSVRDSSDTGELVLGLKIQAMVGLVRVLLDSGLERDANLQFAVEGVEGLLASLSQSGVKGSLDPDGLAEICRVGICLLLPDDRGEWEKRLVKGLAALYHYAPDLPDALEELTPNQLCASLMIEKAANFIAQRGVLDERKDAIKERLNRLEEQWSLQGFDSIP